MAEFASNAKGNAALTTGIIGTAGVGLGLLNGGQNEWSGGKKIQLLSRETAMEWAEEHLDGDEYIAAFGDPEETGKAMSVILPIKTRERLEALKHETGMTFSEIIARAIEKY